MDNITKAWRVVRWVLISIAALLAVGLVAFGGAVFGECIPLSDEPLFFGPLFSFFAGVGAVIAAAGIVIAIFCALAIYRILKGKRMEKDRNVEYYNKNAAMFFAGTVGADMSLWRDKFEKYILGEGSGETDEESLRSADEGETSEDSPEESLRNATGKKILDAGCGSGRDSLAFMKHGYSVVAFDASSEMCRMASELIGQEVLKMRFDEIEYVDEFDGIWACASLLHVPYNELPGVLGKLYRAMKAQGTLYVSFKYGEGTKQRGERVFSDFTEESARALLDEAGYEVMECGVTTDIRPDRADEKWVNMIARKK